MAGADTALRSTDQGTRRYPPVTTATVTAAAGTNYIKKHFPKEAEHVFWGSVECGLVLPSISAWEVVSKEKFKTTGRYMCRFLRLLEGEPGWLPAVADHGVAQGQGDVPAAEPPEAVQPMDQGPHGVLQAGGAHGAASGRATLWTVILSNPEKSGLTAIQSVAKQAILKGVGNFPLPASGARRRAGIWRITPAWDWVPPTLPEGLLA